MTIFFLVVIGIALFLLACTLWNAYYWWRIGRLMCTERTIHVVSLAALAQLEQPYTVCELRRMAIIVPPADSAQPQIPPTMTRTQAQALVPHGVRFYRNEGNTWKVYRGGQRIGETTLVEAGD